MLKAKHPADWDIYELQKTKCLVQSQNGFWKAREKYRASTNSKDLKSRFDWEIAKVFLKWIGSKLN